MPISPLAVLAVIALPQVGSVELSSSLIDVSGIGHNRTIPCQGRAVEVAGSNHVLTFTGTCASLDLSGTNNQVTINLAPNASLVVAGSNQTVRWRSTTQPKLDQSGAGNRVIRLPN